MGPENATTGTVARAVATMVGEAMAAAMEAAAQVVVRVVARAEVEREAATAAATAVARAEAVKAAAQVVVRARYMSAGGGDPLRQRTCTLGWGELCGKAGRGGSVRTHHRAESNRAAGERPLSVISSGKGGWNRGGDGLKSTAHPHGVGGRCRSRPRRAPRGRGGGGNWWGKLEGYWGGEVMCSTMWLNQRR